MSIQQFLSSDFANRLGWTLVHSLWQGTAIAALLAIALSALRRRTSQARYAASTGALAMMLVCVGVTFGTIASSRSAAVRAARPSASTAGGLSAQSADGQTIAPAAAPLPPTITAEPAHIPIPHAAVVDSAPAAPPDIPSKWVTLSQSVTLATPWLCGAWLIGVLALSVWHFGGWIAAQRLRVLGVRPVDADVTTMTERLTRRLGLARTPTVLQSLLADTPMVIGWLRPIVLIPIAALSGLTPQQLEAVLAHELAHVRRYDYLVNLFQVAAETLLFYHPAVWFVSRRIRLEREQCCDDVALSVCQDRWAYASSLAALEEVRLVGSPALAASGSGGSQLLTRVRRVLGIGDDPARPGARATAAILVLLSAAITAAGLSGKSPQVSNEWAEKHGWAAQNVQPTSLNSTLGGWRNLAFSLSADEEADARACVALALKGRQTINGKSEFFGLETRHGLEQILAKRPGYFYAELLLGLWHRENGDAQNADRLMEAAYMDAPTVVVQRFAFADGSALAGVVVQSFALECNRVEHGSLDPSLKLYYPNLHTDARGCIYLPVYNTVLRADEMASLQGCDVAWPKLGWFETSLKVALLPVATVTSQAVATRMFNAGVMNGADIAKAKGDVAVAEAELLAAAHGDGAGASAKKPELDDRERFLAVERIARLSAAEQAGELSRLYHELAPPCMNPMVEGILSSHPTNILDRNAANGFNGNTKAWARQLADAAPKLSPERLADKLKEHIWITVAARARALQVFQAHPEATEAFIREDLKTGRKASVQRACDAIQSLNLQNYTDQLLNLYLAGGEAAEPASMPLIFSSDPAIVKPLLAAVKKDPKLLIRCAGLFQGPLGGRPAEPALVILLDSDDPDVRNAAAEALSECLDPSLANPIVKLVHDTDPRLHSAGLCMAMHLPDEAFKAIRSDLLPLLRSKTNGVEYSAIKCFAGRKDLAVGPVLLEKLQLDSMSPGDAVTIMQAIDALAGSTLGYDQHNWGPAHNQATIRKFAAWLRGRGVVIEDHHEARGNAGNAPGAPRAAVEKQADSSGTLTGTVTDEAGNPQAGVLLHVWSWCDGIQTHTDEHGRYTLKDLGAEPIEIRVSRDGFGPWYNAQQPLGGELNIKLSNRTYFEGVVRSPDGNPVGNALVRAYSSPKKTAGSLDVNLWTQARSDAKGNYRLYVMPDSYTVLMRAPGIGAVKLPAQSIADGQKTPLDIQLTRGVAFRAQIVDSQTGAPVPNVKLGHWQHPGVEGTSDKDGNLVIETMDPGNFTFNISAKGYARWWSAQAAQDHQKKETRDGFHRNFDDLDFDVTPDMKPVRIELEREVRITGVVHDPDGNPVAGATVAPAHTGTGNSLTGDTRYSVLTERDGTFVMTLPASGNARYNLEAHDGKYGQWRQWANGVLDPIRTNPGDEIRNVVIRLSRPTSVRGTVKDPTGKPIAGREVRAQASDMMENRYYDPTTTTDRNGKFVLRFVRPGDQFIQAAPFWAAEDSDGKSSVRVTLKEGQADVSGVELIGPLSTKFPTVEEQIRRMIEKQQAVPASQPALTYGPVTDGLQLALELEASNGVIPMEKPIKARLYFRNAGQAVIKLRNPTFWQPNSDEFVVTDSHGAKAQSFGAWYSFFDVGRVDELQPGQAVAVDTHVVAFFPESFDLKKVPHPVGNWALVKPGKYTVQYKLRCPTLPNDTAGSVVWHDQLMTAPLQIEVASAAPEKAAAPTSLPATSAAASSGVHGAPVPPASAPPASAPPASAPPAAQPALEKERAKAMKADIRHFVLDIRYHGDQDKPYYNLRLSVAPVPAAEQNQPFDLRAQITERQAADIIDYLYSVAPKKAINRSDDPGYALTAGAYHEEMGWDLAMLGRLECIDTFLDGDPGKNLGQLLQRLSGFKKQWEQAQGAAPATRPAIEDVRGTLQTVPATDAAPAALPAKKAEVEPRYTDISGTVVDDATGKPVSNFSVQGGHVDEKDPTKITWGYTLETTTSPNPTGRFSSRVEWSGGWRSRIVADGYVGEPVLLKLPDDNQHEFKGRVIRLKRGRQVSGHVLDHAGKPVVDAGVFVVGNPSVNLTGGRAMELAGGFLEDKKAVRVATDANGAFTVTGVAEDRHHIAVTCPALDLWVAEVPKEGGNIDDLTIRLPEPGKLVVHYDIAGAPGKAQIFLQYRTWDMFKDARVENHRYAAISQREETVLNNLAPGEYVIDRAKNPGNAYEPARTLLDRRNIKIESGKTVVVDFVRLIGAPIAGQIIGLDQGEIAKAHPTRVVVRVVPVEEDQWSSVAFDDITMEQGGKPIQSDFVTERMSPGQYKVRVEVYVPETQEQRVSTGIVPPAFEGQSIVTVPENGRPELVKIELRPWTYHPNTTSRPSE
jgi:beta-lactamase regulating signal transducer with metallopeptidase domain/protocatechuate 3,4-dioxygenase beta subunit